MVCYWPSHLEVRILIGRILLKFEYNKVGHGHEMSRNVSFGKGPFSWSSFKKFKDVNAVWMNLVTENRRW